MNETILHGLPQQFSQLAARTSHGEDVEAELIALVSQTREAAGTDVGWKREVEKIRGRLRVQKIALDTSNTALPDKLANHRQRAFYVNAVTRLTTVIEAE